MRRNKRKTTKMSLLMMLLLLGIGFAALTANLKINGTVDVSKASWDVHFENVSITEGSVTATTVPTSDDETTTEMTYAVNFTKPGDFYEFTVDIVNDGSIDAMVDLVTNKVYSSDGETEITLPNYLKSSVTYDDGLKILPNQLLEKQTSEKIKVRVEFRTDIDSSDLPSTADTIVFKFKGDFKQADDGAEPVRLEWLLPTGKTKDNLEVGDEICILDQCFNFIRYDGTNNKDIVMLSKYNLKVGNIYEGRTKAGEYTNSDSGYGLQSSEARGYVSGASTYNGTVAFSTTNYWDDNDSPSSSYPGSYYPGPDFPAIYDPINYAGTPGESNYSVVYYVEGYKTKLTGYGVTIKDARLLTYEEAIDPSIGCDASNYSCPTNGFIRNTTFWIGAAYNKIAAWRVDTDGFFSGRYDNEGEIGVRPVIVVSKENM